MIDIHVNHTSWLRDNAEIDRALCSMGVDTLVEARVAQGAPPPTEADIALATPMTLMFVAPKR